MYPSSKKPDFNISSGTIVTGKWHQKHYQILKPLGYGAQGTVFLAHSERGRVALKFAHENANVISEVNVLNKFSKVQGKSLGPSLYDVDDWVTDNGSFSFYAMEYINGTPLLDCVRVRGFEWMHVFMLQLLKDLDRLHREGWAFGDLKPENLIVTGPPLTIRWLDVGGITQIGRSIKEYTEFFDRGYWGMGSRKAEPSYDLFACAMILINAATQKRFEKDREPDKQLIAMISRIGKLEPYRHILKNALVGDYLNARQMREDLLLNISETQSEDKRNYNTAPRPRKKKKEWKGTLVLATVILFAYILYVVFFIM
ncbi:protein kinase family protein [Camelliibacillus cellulosilyticus]|uniref:Protein kinase family protein n=1 Tax=Camelliibacillus cellulosilyticus TaxID=2174486 RepID=A0ABV9GS50_9BACL